MDQFNEELARAFVEKKTKVCRSLTGHNVLGDETQDMLQDACVQALLLHRKHGEVRNMSAFLWSTTRNLALNALNIRATRRRLNEQLVIESLCELTPERILEARQALTLVKQEIANLTIREQQALTLTAYQDLSPIEIGTAMGYSHRQVRRWLKSARRQVIRDRRPPR